MDLCDLHVVSIEMVSRIAPEAREGQEVTRRGRKRLHQLSALRPLYATSIVFRHTVYMCGRYRLSRRKQILEEQFAAVSDDADWSPRYNIAPTQFVPVVRQNPGTASRALSLVQWRLVPSWAKDSSQAAAMINARSETVGQQALVEDTQGPYSPGGIATRFWLCCQRVQHVIRIALPGLRLLIDQGHDAGKCRRRCRRAADPNDIEWIASASSINVGLADNIEVRVEAISREQRDIGNDVEMRMS